MNYFRKHECKFKRAQLDAVKRDGDTTSIVGQVRGQDDHIPCNLHKSTWSSMVENEENPCTTCLVGKKYAFKE